MSVVLESNARDAMVDALTDLLDGGTIVFETSGDVEVATCTFGSPSFAASSGGTAAANAIASDTDADGGTIEHASCYTSGAAKVLEADVTVTGGGGAITGASIVIAATETVSVSTLTITQPSGA